MESSLIILSHARVIPKLQWISSKITMAFWANCFFNNSKYLMVASNRWLPSINTKSNLMFNFFNSNNFSSYKPWITLNLLWLLIWLKRSVAISQSFFTPSMVIKFDFFFSSIPLRKYWPETPKFVPISKILLTFLILDNS